MPHSFARAVRRLVRDETVIAVVGGLVDVQEGHDVPFLDMVTLHGPDVPAHLGHDAHAHMLGDDGARDAAQLPVMHMHVRPEHLGVRRMHPRCALCELGFRKLTDFDRDVRGVEDGGLMGLHDL